ncbi:GGDEF domain-containing protein [Massilia sp. G4R7]|uniref:diguanylate cyclase n=1 Tax=Massilia phyllostachyos TaxID=2898585 RepID=A0ABS8Q368_9BURK|nr:GGDEF domain-containing protein [Massilia phyllostachyos]MCD2516190.1 GGDEF domain-containing protein [Massilia phyllostachyos]
MAAHHDWPEHAPGVANAGRGAGAGWRRGFLAERSTDGLDPEAQGEFDAALDRSLSDALPALGLVFGIGVLLFSAWDYWVDPVVAAGTLVVRLGLVLLGAAGYVSWGGRFPVAWRCALVYITHASAMVVSSALLPGGMVLAMPAITGAMFPLALVEPRPARLAVLVLPPSLLFLLLAAQVMAPPVFATCVLVYGVVLCLVAAVAVFQRRLLRADFLAERVLAWTARHDSLSGVLARGYLMELAGHDLAAARRYGRPLAIAMLDIDYFKRVNDSWGHAVGDRLLCAVSRACAAQLRASDYLGRVGGEEFVCVMPETGEAEALACAERMRVAVAAIRLDAPGGVVRCTASLGVAALGSAHADFTALMAAADGALYRAKSNGRDRIELAGRQADE